MTTDREQHRAIVDLVRTIHPHDPLAAHLHPTDVQLLERYSVRYTPPSPGGMYPASLEGRIIVADATVEPGSVAIHARMVRTRAE